MRFIILLVVVFFAGCQKVVVEENDPLQDSVDKACKIYAPRVIRAFFKEPNVISFAREWRVFSTRERWNRSVTADSTVKIHESFYSVEVYFTARDEQIDVDIVVIDGQVLFNKHAVEGSDTSFHDDFWKEEVKKLPTVLQSEIEIPTRGKADAVFKSTTVEQLTE